MVEQMKLIHIVADKNTDLEGAIALLHGKRFQTKHYSTPDSAYDALVDSKEEGMVLINAMMFSSIWEEKIRYDLDKTNSGYETGLALLKDLVEANPDKFPSNAVLYTDVSTDHRVHIAAEKVSSELGVPLLRMNGDSKKFAYEITELYDMRSLKKEVVTE